MVRRCKKGLALSSGTLQHIAREHAGQIEKEKMNELPNRYSEGTGIEYNHHLKKTIKVNQFIYSV
ncbi:MAG: hypothetical protein R2864_10025 [Syntrophotaleaceae bacterium]